MHPDTSPPAGRTAVVLAGIALIVLPIVAAALKFASFGWYMALLLMLLVPIPLMLAGYIVQIVLAIRGYLRAGGFVHTAPNRARLVAAAWATTIGGVLTAFFTVDGGDHEWGSTFMLWTGLASNSAAGDVSTVLAWIAASAWVLGWVWLVVEWILARRSPATGA